MRDPLRPEWPCICPAGRHVWCPQHGYVRPEPTLPLPLPIKEMEEMPKDRLAIVSGGRIGVITGIVS